MRRAMTGFDLLVRLTFLVVALLLIASDAFAEGAAPACRPWAEWEARLGREYGEAPAWVGVAADGAQTIVTANPEGTTWSILRIAPGGPACLVGDGIAWAAIDLPIPGERS